MYNIKVVKSLVYLELQVARLCQIPSNWEPTLHLNVSQSSTQTYS